MLSRIAITAIAALAVASGYGGGDGDKAGGTSDEVRQRLTEAGRVSAADFPATRGRTLQQIANALNAGSEMGLATSVYTPGRNRLAFGVIDKQGSFVYGKTAVYVARGPNDKARGPFAAPADSLISEPRFRSRQAASEESEIAAIYATEVSFARPGRYALVAVTRVGSRLVGASSGVRVKQSSPIPGLREHPPTVDTDTLASAGGDIKKIDTRIPPDDMHDTGFKDALGKRPIALLFATPQLCQSRVCGPVVDIAFQLEQTYGNRIQFIHQEVYVDNEVKKGLRPPLRAFGLRTEPWLFTFNKQGRVAARLEGSFGIDEFRQALESALE